MKKKKSEKKRVVEKLQSYMFFIDLRQTHDFILVHMSSLCNCDFASFSEEPCHSLNYHHTAKLLDFKAFDEEQQQIYIWRADGLSKKCL